MTELVFWLLAELAFWLGLMLVPCVIAKVYMHARDRAADRRVRRDLFGGGLGI